MTTKTINGHYPSGYDLKSTYSQLDIGASATVGGTGVSLTAAGTVFNSGKVTADSVDTGMTLRSGGTIYNEVGGGIYGRVGVLTGGGFSGTVANYGDIIGSSMGIDMGSPGGALRNSGVVAGGDYGVLIRGGTIANSGEIYAGSDAFYQTAVILEYGARLTNGSLTQTNALISGAVGVNTTGGLVTNFGTIEAHTFYTWGKAVYLGLHSNASLINGAATDLKALISGDTGVVSYLSVSTVTNFGTIEGSGSDKNPGIYFDIGGGTVTNGGKADKTALIQGYAGLKDYNGAATVTNFGTIDGTGSGPAAYGVVLDYTGSVGALRVTNGSTGDKSALIEGGVGVEISSEAGTVKNFGTILAGASAGEYGVELEAGGSLANGAKTDTTALIEGQGGVELQGGTATNFGTIRSTGASYGLGALLIGGASLTNGAVGDTTAVIEGPEGVFVSSAGSTVTNFGTISSEIGGTALQLDNPSDTLAVEAGSTFIGLVSGDKGTLDLASGVGTLTGLLSAGGNVTVSGSMAATVFSDFATVEVSAGATFTADGASALATGQTVIDRGKLIVAGALTNAGILEVAKGVLTVDGSVSGGGQAVIAGGILHFAAGFTQNVDFSGVSGELELNKSQGYAGAVTGFSLTGGTSFDLRDIGFVSAGEATFSGNATSGVLTVTDGTHTAHITLMGDYLSSTFTASSDGKGGTTIVDPLSPLAAHRFIAAAASLGATAGSSIHTDERWSAREAVLVSPRAMMA